MFNHKDIEKKWQQYWEKNNSYYFNSKSDLKKYYVLDMFPYPSGQGLHVGHPKGYTATDIVARFKRFQGFNVLHPIGWDAFGLPAEQYAIKTGNNPATFTEQNIQNFRKQLKSLGFSFDYSKEVNTTDPKFYKWTQWIFIQLYKKGLAEVKDVDVNWCPELKTVLANEEVLVKNGKMVSERGNHPVVKKPMRQWILKITKYADKLLEGLNDLDWPEGLKDLQRNWIGKSIGAEIKFNVKDTKLHFDVFTTRADTIYGITYVVLSPENKLVNEIVSKEQSNTVKHYQELAKTKTDLERQELNKEKTGVFSGAYAIHPITKKEIPIWIADYVLNSYGTGAVMAVPAHDERDYAFAKKYKLPIKSIIENSNLEHEANVEDGKHIDSDFINGLLIKEAITKVIDHLEKHNIGKKKVNYKLRDWLFSRQRYWGELFPLIHYEDGTIETINESELPLILPSTNNFLPSDEGKSPLENLTDWVNITNNGKKAKRETNTMPQWAGSCWYYIAYLLKQDDGSYLDLNSKEAKAILNKWLPVDLYVGGQEHAVLHLLYSRFWHKFLFDIGILDKSEPFQKLFNQGMILGEDGTKMSKSVGNVINPTDILESHGADSLRLYEMFMGPLDASLAWSNNGLDGSKKWLERIYRLLESNKIIDTNSKELDASFNIMVKKVTSDIESLKFNTAISSMMIFINDCYSAKSIYKKYFEGFITILSTFCPHLAEELWSTLGHKVSVTKNKWPECDEKLTVSDTITIVCQINGKIRAKFDVSHDISKDEIIKLCKNDKNVMSYLEDKKIIKEIYVPKKLVSFVIE